MGTTETKPAAHPDAAATPAGTTAGATRPAAERGGGLCATCAKRESCPRRETEGGVWRCADYEE